MFLRLFVHTVARIVFVVLLSGMVTRVSAQTSDCAITGVLFNPDGTAASLKQVSAISVVKSGRSFLIAPVTIITDAGGLAAFVVPKSSTLWIPASALGISQQGDVALPIPDADTAALNVLALQGKPPVAGFSLTSGANPSLAVSLKDFGINLAGAAASPALTVESFNGRTGAVALAGSDVTSALGFTPVDPGAVVGLVNASSGTINAARLAPEVVRRDLANVFTTRQNLGAGADIAGPSNAASALTIQKGTGTSSALDIRIDGTGKALRLFYPGIGEPGTYFNDSGMLYTSGWMVISGTSHGHGDGYGIDHPSSDPSMLQVWSDVGGPAFQVRNSPSGTGYLFSGLDSLGNYAFSIEGNGGLQWGSSSRAAMDTNLYRVGTGSLKTDGSLTIAQKVYLGTPDTNLYRSAAGTLKTDASLTIGQNAFVGQNVYVGNVDTNLYRAGASTLKTDGSLSVGQNALFSQAAYFGTLDTSLYRNAVSQLRTNSSFVVDGKLGIGGFSSAYPVYVAGSAASGWNKTARFEASQNVDGAGGVLELGISAQLFGGRIYAGRWSTANRGVRLSSVSQLGQETSWLHLNGQDSSATVNTAGIDRFVVTANGNIGINTNAPAADALLEISGGSGKGFRIAPRSTQGPPSSGTWSSGTIIVDAAGTVFICVTAGSPGTWKSLTTDGPIMTGSVVNVDPTAPAAGAWKLYVRTDSIGAPQLCVILATGTPQCFARPQ